MLATTVRTLSVNGRVLCFSPQEVEAMFPASDRTPSAAGLDSPFSGRLLVLRGSTIANH